MSLGFYPLLSLHLHSENISPFLTMDSTYSVQIGERIITTTVTANPYTVADWIHGVNCIYHLKQTVVVGLDVEWRPNRYSGYSNPAATLQLCVGNRCLIVQLIHIDRFPPSLQRFLRNPRYMFAGVEIASDAEKLDQDYGLVCENLYDLREVAVANWPGNFSRWPGLQELASVVAKLLMEKPRHVTLSDWANQVLTGQQIHYACVDAFASCRVGVKFIFDYDW